jgi:hypothetical protein
MTVYSGLHDTRWTIVVKTADVANANLAARVVEPDGDTFTVGLRNAGDATNTITAYWCSWQMPSAVASNLAGQVRSRLGLTAQQMAVVPPTNKAGYTPPAGWRLLVFDGTFGTGWTPDEILAKLGLATRAV